MLEVIKIFANWKINFLISLECSIIKEIPERGQSYA